MIYNENYTTSLPGATGSIVDKVDGAPRRSLDVGRLAALGNDIIQLSRIEPETGQLCFQHPEEYEVKASADAGGR